MRIGIDARFSSESGVGRYLRNFLTNLKILDKKNEYFIFLLPKDFDKFSETRNFRKVAAPFKWYGFGEQFNFPKLLYRFNLDLMHFPHFNVPIFYKGKFVVTIHDLIHQHYAMNRATTLNPLSYKIKQLGYRKVFKTAIQKSLKILVPSDFVRKDLMKEWNVSSDKITVTPEAVDDKLAVIGSKISQKQTSKVLSKFNIRPPYLFYVGNAHPHKNVEGLIKSFNSLSANYQNLQLVLSGADHYFWQRLKTEKKLKNVYFTGYVTEDELAVLYKSAKAFVLPSFEEGFGIPLLEAMALGCPVVASNTGALPEVGGGASVYFNPRDTGDMVEKITQVLNSNNLRKDLVKKGKKRVKLFSWEKLAKQTLNTYEQCTPI